MTQFFAEFGEKRLDANDLFDMLDGLSIDAGCAAIDPDLLPGRPQYVLTIEFIVEGAEPPIQRLFRCTGEFALQ